MSDPEKATISDYLGNDRLLRLYYVDKKRLEKKLDKN